MIAAIEGLAIPAILIIVIIVLCRIIRRAEREEERRQMIARVLDHEKAKDIRGSVFDPKGGPR